MILMNGFTYSYSFVSRIKTYRTVSICCRLPLISFRFMCCGRAHSTSTKIKHYIDVLPFHRCPRPQLTRHTCHCLNGEWYRKKEKNNRRLCVCACVRFIYAMCMTRYSHVRFHWYIPINERTYILILFPRAAYHVPAPSAHIAYSKTIRRASIKLNQYFVVSHPHYNSRWSWCVRPSVCLCMCVCDLIFAQQEIGIRV